MRVSRGYSGMLEPSDLITRHFTSIGEVEEMQLAHCAALQRQPGVIRSTTLFHW